MFATSRRSNCCVAREQKKCATDDALNILEQEQKSANLVQLLDDREDEQCCNEADAHQSAPNYCKVETPHVSWN